MTPGAVLHLENPRVGVEAQFSRKALLDLGLRSGLFAEAPTEQPVRWTRIVEHALGRGAERQGAPISVLYQAGLLLNLVLLLPLLREFLKLCDD